MDRGMMQEKSCKLRTHCLWSLGDVVLLCQLPLHSLYNCINLVFYAHVMFL